MGELVMFRIGGSSYALSVDAISEVRELGPISPFPSARTNLVGLTRVHGRWIPVVDLPREWRAASDSESVGGEPRLIVLGQDRVRLGLRVDDFGGIVDVAGLQAGPAHGSEPKTYVQASGELVHCINPAALLASQDPLMDVGGGTMTENRATAESIQLVAFRIGPEEFGLDVMKVFEVHPVPEIRMVPQAPDFVEGVAELREGVLPVIDLRKRFGLSDVSDGAGARLLVVSMGESRVGLVVDSVPGVLEFSADALTPAPDYFKGIAARYLTGVINVEGRLIVLLNIDEILNSKERLALETVAEGGHSESKAVDGAAQTTRKSRRGKGRAKKKGS